MSPPASSPAPGPWRAAAVLGLGSAFAGSSSALFKLAAVSPVTGAFLRCALAMLVLAPLAAREVSRTGWPSPSVVRNGLLSGVFLAADYVMWNQTINDVGAAVATVLIGVQVVVFPVLAWLFSGERLQGRFLIALPLMLAGLALTGGLLGSDPQAENPVRGTLLGVGAGVFYAGYLYLNRLSSQAAPGYRYLPVALGTGSAAVCIGMFAAFSGGLSLDLSARQWLLMAAIALGGQALAFLLIGYGTMNLDSGRAAAILMVQPLTAVLLGTLALGETPDAWQYTGIVLTLAAIVIATVRGRPRPLE